MQMVHTGSYSFDYAVPSLSQCCCCYSCVSHLKGCRNHQLCSKSPCAHTERCIMWNFLVQDKSAEVFTSAEFSSITSERSILFPFPKRESEKWALKEIKTDSVTNLPFSPCCVQPGRHLWIFLRFLSSNYYFLIPRQTSRNCVLLSVIIMLSTTASATANCSVMQCTWKGGEEHSWQYSVY